MEKTRVGLHPKLSRPVRKFRVCFYGSREQLEVVVPHLHLSRSVRKVRWVSTEAVRLSVVIALTVLAVPTFAAAPTTQVLKIVINDTIQPVTDEFIGRALTEAKNTHADALLIEINTPGGLVDSTREIIEKIVDSPVPVIVYVTPSGSRAASAGFFILESADIAAMAPGTNTGAAHPVTIGGAKMDDIMKQKIENDLAAFMRSSQHAAAATSMSPKAPSASPSISPSRKLYPKS